MVREHYFHYGAKRATGALATGRGQLKGATGTDWMRDPYVHDLQGRHLKNPDKSSKKNNRAKLKRGEHLNMRISHKHKFVYIAIEKTGSSTMRYLLHKHSDIISKTGQGDFAHHNTAQKLKDVFNKNDWDWDDYLKFTVVRHPISRIYSMYKYILRVASNPPTEYMKKHEMPFYDSCKKLKDLNITFDDAVLGDKISLPPQSNWILSSDKSTSLLDQIIKIEHISSELPGIWNQLELPLHQISSIPKINESPSEKPWESVLSNKAIQKLASKYAGDFQLLNYSLAPE